MTSEKNVYFRTNKLKTREIIFRWMPYEKKRVKFKHDLKKWNSTPMAAYTIIIFILLYNWHSLKYQMNLFEFNFKS